MKYKNTEDLQLKERTQLFFSKLEQLDSKLKSLGVKRKSVLMAASDLCDIYIYAEVIRKNIDQLINTPSSNWEKFQELFVEIDVLLLHLKDHIIHSRKPLQYLAEICDKHTIQEKNDNN